MKFELLKAGYAVERKIKQSRVFFLTIAYLFIFVFNHQAQTNKKNVEPVKKASNVQATTCALKNAERIWIEQSLNLWEKVSRDSLRLASEPLPWMILFDETCGWHVNPNLSVSILKLPADSVKTNLSFAGKSVDAYVFAHNGKILLPDKQQISPQLLTFAATYGDSGDKSFLAAALPSVWRQAPHLKSEANLDILIRSVFVHEMTHTRHRNFFAALNRIEKNNSFPEGLNDDIVQTRFSKQTDFSRMFEVERDLLFQAALETDLRRKCELAQAAYTVIQERRRKFLVGGKAIYSEIEDIFLTMEGAANWAAYRAAVAEGLTEAEAMKLIRRGGKYWSQDEGFALFLVIDSLLPGWQKKAFDKSKAFAVDLLKQASMCFANCQN